MSVLANFSNKFKLAIDAINGKLEDSHLQSAMAEMDSVKAQRDAFETALKEKTVALSDMTSKYEASEAQVKALTTEKTTLETNLSNAQTELNKYNGGGGVPQKQEGTNPNKPNETPKTAQELAAEVDAQFGVDAYMEKLGF